MERYNKDGTIEVSAVVPADKAKSLLRLNKNIIRAEFTLNVMILDECRWQIVRKEYLYKRLFFLKKFGYPLGCIWDAFNPWISVIRDSCTSDGRETDYAYNGVRFMEKIIKPTKKWLASRIYLSTITKRMESEDWIKTSDRLPENSDWVVVCIVNLFGTLPPLFDLAS